MNDILDAVPIDKYFELFKPNGGGEGGFIRISMNFYKQAADIPRTGESGAKQSSSFGCSGTPLWVVMQH